MTEIKEETNSSLYPNIVKPEPSAPPAIFEMGDNGQSFRLNKISEVQKFLEDEVRIRDGLAKKFKKYSKWVDNVESGLTVVAIGAGTGGIALLSTIVAIPVTIGLEITSLVVGLAAITSKFFIRRMRTKSEKHAQIKNIADSKLNTLNAHISIADNKVSHEEFSLIMEELEKYKVMKEEIRSKSNKKKKAEEENSLIERGKREAREEFRKLMEKNHGGLHPH